jgi:hypothetical protein
LIIAKSIKIGFDMEIGTFLSQGGGAGVGFSPTLHPPVNLFLLVFGYALLKSTVPIIVFVSYTFLR